MRITTFFILLFYACHGLTQNVDFGLCIGGSNYSGDLTENANAALKQTHPSFGLHGRVEIDPMLSLQLQYMYLEVSGDDKLAIRAGNRARNLNFNSKIQELSFLGQIQILNIFSEKAKRISPYLQFGVSGFHFNPTTEFKGNTVELQPLGTEGQGMPNYEPRYKLTNFALCFGFGVRYFISSKYSIALDAFARQTNTDYLDDASTNYVAYELLQNNNGKMAADLGNKILAKSGTKRANPIDKDWYQSLSIVISYHFGKKYHYRNPSLRKNQILCPFF
ncbi:MAG: DUF6089 family protein [Saprospiraceae bacterium]